MLAPTEGQKETKVKPGIMDAITSFCSLLVKKCDNLFNYYLTQKYGLSIFRFKGHASIITFGQGSDIVFVTKNCAIVGLSAFCVGCALVCLQ